MGKSSGGGDAGQGQAALKQAELAEKLFEQTDPLRELFAGRGESFLEGGADVTQTPGFANLKQAIETQFGRAKEGVLSDQATGGGLSESLAGLQGDRAKSLVSGISGLQENELARSFALATGTAPTALGALGQAGQTQAGLANAAANRSSSGKAALGSGAGLYAGLSKAGGAGAAGAGAAAALSAAPAIGAGIGSSAALLPLSSRDYKENIHEYDIDALSDMIQNVKIVQYDYLPEYSGKKNVIGMIAEETPDAFTTPDKKQIEIMNLIGGLIAANQVLTRKVELMESSHGK